jgi:hypothetical protein
MSSPTDVQRRERIIALRIAAGAFLAIVIIALNGYLTFPLIAWLPESTLVSMGYPAQDIHHIVHGVAIALEYGTLVICFAVQLRRPQRSVAPLWLIILILGGQIVYDAVQGTVGDPIWWLMYALFAAMVALHPRRTAPITRINRAGAWLAGAATLPMAVQVLNQLRLQFAAPDPYGHAAANHFVAAAMFTTIIVAAAWLGSTDLPGARLTAWIAGVNPLVFAVASLAHPDRVGAWPAGWALAAIAWSAAYLLIVALQSRPAKPVAADFDLELRR